MRFIVLVGCRGHIRIFVLIGLLGFNRANGVWVWGYGEFVNAILSHRDSSLTQTERLSTSWMPASDGCCGIRCFSTPSNRLEKRFGHSANSATSPNNSKLDGSEQCFKMFSSPSLVVFVRGHDLNQEQVNGSNDLLGDVRQCVEPLWSEPKADPRALQLFHLRRHL